MGRRWIAVALTLFASGCYLSHERGGSDAGSRSDAGARADAGIIVDPCGSIYVALDVPGCTTFPLPSTRTESCTTPDGATVTGPSFVFSVPSGTPVGVHITDDGTIESAFGPAVDACGGLCAWGHTTGTGGSSDYFTPDVSVRYVVRTFRRPTEAYEVTICAPERAPD